MGIPKIESIGEEEFHTLVGHLVHPATAFLHCEIGWFATENRSAVGPVILDKVDEDYSWVCFVQEPDGYVCADVQCSLVTAHAARHALEWRPVAADAQSVAAFGVSKREAR
jgi:hypothetical protein